MPIIDLEQADTFTSDHGESVTELVGPNANGSKGYSIAACEIAVNSASENHYHPVVEETYIITNGTAKMVADGEITLLEPGDTYVVTAKAEHQIFNTGDKPLKFMAICVPEWTPDCSVFCEPSYKEA